MLGEDSVRGKVFALISTVPTCSSLSDALPPGDTSARGQSVRRRRSVLGSSQDREGVVGNPAHWDSPRTVRRCLLTPLTL